MHYVLGHSGDGAPCFLQENGMWLSLGGFQERVPPEPASAARHTAPTEEVQESRQPVPAAERYFLTSSAGGGDWRCLPHVALDGSLLSLLLLFNMIGEPYTAVPRLTCGCRFAYSLHVRVQRFRKSARMATKVATQQPALPVGCSRRRTGSGQELLFSQD